MTIKAKVTKILTETIQEGVGSFQDGIMIGTVGADVRECELANVAVRISCEHFSEIVEAMMTANPEKASKAFGSALRKEVVPPRAFRPRKHKRGLPSHEEMVALLERCVDRM